jgi:phosphoribosyl 1,2-cyclic phosphodiesterase
MKIKFYGTRGSTPISDYNFMKFGGNTSSILVTLNSGQNLIFDAGTGIRQLGHDLVKNGYTNDLSIILSHTHWDHIQGFPFFGPSFIPDNKLIIAICGIDNVNSNLHSIFDTQMQPEYFPVQLERMGANFEFFQPEYNEYTGPYGNKWEFYKHKHPGGAYSYRLMTENKVFVYCTDIEHGEMIDKNVIHIARNADLLIHDAQYTPEELPSKRGWGHSSFEQAVSVAEQACVKKLALFHHDPDHNDEFLMNLEKRCQIKFPNSFFARDGMELHI